MTISRAPGGSRAESCSRMRTAGTLRPPRPCQRLQFPAMNAAYVHLVVNHFPPILAIAALILLVLTLFWRNDGARRAAILLVVLAAVSAIPAYQSGEGAEEIVEEVQGVNVQAIEPHEEWGEATLILLSIAGVAAIAALVAFRATPVPAWAAVVLTLALLAATVVAVRTAFLGGRIRHPETAIQVRQE